MPVAPAGIDAAYLPGRSAPVARTRLYSGVVADFPLPLPDPVLAARLAAAIDIDGKIPRTIDSLGSLRDRDVVLLDDVDGFRAAQLRALGARLTLRPEASVDGLEPSSADAILSFWGPLGQPSDETAGRIEAAGRALRPGGRLLIVSDYGRDEVALLLPGGDDPPVYRALLRRDSWYLAAGFKLRVIHGWWSFETIDEARGLLEAGFGELGATVAAGLRRPRLAHKMVVYHRTFGEPAASAQDAASTAGGDANAPEDGALRG